MLLLLLVSRHHYLLMMSYFQMFYSIVAWLVLFNILLLLDLLSFLLSIKLLNNYLLLLPETCVQSNTFVSILKTFCFMVVYFIVTASFISLPIQMTIELSMFPHNVLSLLVMFLSDVTCMLDYQETSNYVPFWCRVK